MAFLAAQRHTDEGTGEARGVGAHQWAFQQREDAGEAVGEIPAPPKYDQKDHREGRYGSLRGNARRAAGALRGVSRRVARSEGSPLRLRRGETTCERARALAALYQQRKNSDGWDRDRLRPLLAGLQELLPWLLQWHNDPSPELDGQREGDVWAEFLEGERATLGWSEDDLRAWRPSAPPRKERAKKAVKG